MKTAEQIKSAVDAIILQSELCDQTEDSDEVDIWNAMASALIWGFDLVQKTEGLIEFDRMLNGLIAEHDQMVAGYKDARARGET